MSLKHCEKLQVENQGERGIFNGQYKGYSGGISFEALDRKRKRFVNDKLPENLPIEIVEHDRDEKECPECGENLHVMEP